MEAAFSGAAGRRRMGVFFLLGLSVSSLTSAAASMSLVEAAKSGSSVALGHLGLNNVHGTTSLLVLVVTGLAAAYLLFKRTGPKGADMAGVGGHQTPERLQVFAKWAQQQIEESQAGDHRQILDDVILTFAAYAQRMQKGTSRGVQRAAVLRLRVLIELLETPSVNHALRTVNWAWLQQWDHGLVERREAHQRCTVVFPTIMAAEKMRHSEARRGWFGHTEEGRPQQETLAYLAGWCADFLERPDTQDLLGMGAGAEDDMPMSPVARTTSMLLAGAIYSESSDDDEEEEASPVRRRRSNSADLQDEDASKHLQEFSRREYEGQEHCWDEPDAGEARVRGPNYLTDKRKVNSKASMMELVAVDLYKSFEDFVHYAKSPKGKIAQMRADGDDRFMFIVNFRLVPIQFACIWAVPKDAGWLQSPEGVLFNRFLDMSDAERNHRVKVLPKVLEGPWLVKQGVPDRPGVVGKKLALEYFKRQDHIEVSINCISSPAGRRLVQLLTGAAKHFSMTLYIILEGQEEDELPERILGCLSVYHGDLGKLAMR